MKESIDQYELQLQYSIERRFQTIIIVRYVDVDLRLHFCRNLNMDAVYNCGYKIINLMAMANGTFGRFILMNYFMYVACGTCSFFFSTELLTFMYEPVDNYHNLLYNISQLCLFIISIADIYFLSSVGQDLATSYRYGFLMTHNYRVVRKSSF